DDRDVEIAIRAVLLVVEADRVRYLMIGSARGAVFGAFRRQLERLAAPLAAPILPPYIGIAAFPRLRAHANTVGVGAVDHGVVQGDCDVHDVYDVRHGLVERGAHVPALGGSLQRVILPEDLPVDPALA